LHIQVQHIHDWIAFCLGGELQGTDAAHKSHKLFLDVLWTRYSHDGDRAGEHLALGLLRKAQMDPGFCPYVDVSGNIPFLNSSDCYYAGTDSTGFLLAR
jgi:sugar (pentulose or hexulose) kinase